MPHSLEIIVLKVSSLLSSLIHIKVSQVSTFISHFTLSIVVNQTIVIIIDKGVVRPIDIYLIIFYIDVVILCQMNIF